MTSDTAGHAEPGPPWRRHAHSAYLGGVWIKGVHGLLDVLIAAVVLVAPQLLPAGLLWTAGEVGDEFGAPGVAVSGALRTVGSDLLSWPGWLLGTFLLVHGLVKIASALCLLRRVVRGYPWAIAALCALLIYQVIDAAVIRSLTMAALAVLDWAVIALVVAEYRKLRPIAGSRRQPRPPSGLEAGDRKRLCDTTTSSARCSAARSPLSASPDA